MVINTNIHSILHISGILLSLLSLEALSNGMFSSDGLFLWGREKSKREYADSGESFRFQQQWTSFRGTLETCKHPKHKAPGSFLLKPFLHYFIYQRVVINGWGQQMEKCHSWNKTGIFAASCSISTFLSVSQLRVRGCTRGQSGHDDVYFHLKLHCHRTFDCGFCSE